MASHSCFSFSAGLSGSAVIFSHCPSSIAFAARFLRACCGFEEFADFFFEGGVVSFQLFQEGIIAFLGYLELCEIVLFSVKCLLGVFLFLCGLILHECLEPVKPLLGFPFKVLEAEDAF